MNKPLDLKDLKKYNSSMMEYSGEVIESVSRKQAYGSNLTVKVRGTKKCLEESGIVLDPEKEFWIRGSQRIDCGEDIRILYDNHAGGRIPAAMFYEIMDEKGFIKYTRDCRD